MKKKKNIIILGIVFVLIAAIVGGNIARSSAKKVASNIEVKKISAQNLSKYITASGVMEGSKQEEVYLQSQYQVKKIYVKKYQKIKKGQKLVDLDLSAIKTTYDTQVQVNAAPSQSASAAKPSQIPVIALPTKIPYPTGIIYPTPTPVVSPTAVPTPNEFASFQSYDQSDISNLLQGGQSASSTTNSGYSNAASQMQSGASYQTVTKTDADAVKKKKELIKLTKAPCSGIIAEINVAKGSYPSTMTASFVIINTDTMQVTAYIKEIDIKDVKKDQPVVITGDSIDPSAVVSGKVVSVAPVASTKTAVSGAETSIEATIRVTDSSVKLIPGTNVSCDIRVMKKDNVPVVDFLSLKEDIDGNKSVFVIDTATGTLKLKKVTLGIISDLSAEVTSGAAVNDLVVADPQPNYTDGMKVTYKAAD